MKIMVAIPCMDQVPTPFCQSIATLKTVEECTIVFNTGSLVYTSRNALATKAMQNEFDYVMWFDSDMEFEPDTLVNMLNTMREKDMDILTGLYFRRVYPYSPVLFDQLDIDGEICYWSEFKEIPEDIFEVGGCGFGCVLMKTDVFFDVQGRFGQMFAPIANNGEDIAFCWRARQCGYKIYCDPSIKLGHVGYTTIDRAFYEALQRSKNGS